MIFLAILLLSSESWASEIAGRVVNVIGKVSAQRGSAAGRQLHPGDTVIEGDTLATGENSAIKLLMSDRTIFDLGASTSFQIKDYQLKNIDDRNVDVSLQYGKIRGLVNSKIGKTGKFSVRTRSTIMGVRGTEFFMSTGIPALHGGPGAGDQTQITVFHGSVDVRNPSVTTAVPVLVTEGRRFSSITTEVHAGSEGGNVVSLSSHELRGTIQEARLSDRTFEQSITIDRGSGTGSGSPGPPGGPSDSGHGPTGGGGSLTIASVAESLGEAPPPPPPPPREIRRPDQITPRAPIGLAPQFGPGRPVRVTIRLNR